MDSESEKINDETAEATEYHVIPVQLVESYQNVGSVALASPTISTNHLCRNSSNSILGKFSSPIKGKYYKQTYRPAWEQMQDFKGWLRGVDGEPTRAYCTYCHKTLHAHRLSLLKHTCTIRHQKASQFHSRKNILGSSKKSDSTTVTHGDKSADKIHNEAAENKDDDEESVDNPENVDVDDGTNDFDYDEEEEEEDDETCPPTQKAQKDLKVKSHLSRPAVSTQVTDMTQGRPVTGLQVSLYKLIDGRWTYINEGVTGSTGKFSDFLSRSDFTPGRYKLHYDVDRYFEAKKQDTMYPFIEIVFDCTLLTECCHIPLLLSPFGYTTYKGS